MDESDPFIQLADVLRQLAGQLPEDYFRTCVNLNENGEWELALGHCLCGLTFVSQPISPQAKASLLEFVIRFDGDPGTIKAVEDLKCSS